MSHVPLNIPQIKAIVFDLDNTLVSSDMDFLWLREQIGCPFNQDLLSYIEDIDCKKTQEDAHSLVLQHELEDAASSNLMPGCQSLLNFIEDNNLLTAVITRNCAEAAQTKLSHNKIIISDVITREHFPPKPAPDSLLFLANEWQLKSSEILYVGDYLYDLQAAFNADMPSCLVTHGNHSPFSSHASLVVDHLSDLEETISRHY
ncbi:HAD family hydrolase [Vibrio sp. TBV020]|uniref:HAD family hydrolase n=1 Tax=Vibrio sp. TBV020 TaxID=3137398 RepID=UPI0038CD9747